MESIVHYVFGSLCVGFTCEKLPPPRDYVLPWVVFVRGKVYSERYEFSLNYGESRKTIDYNLE